jgi:co-chaperonin GroES (HSP10)
MTTKNTSGLRPLGRAVLVEPYEPERKSGLIVMPDNVKERVQTAETRAIVVEVGPACWPDEAPRCKPGDKVLLANMAGTMAKGTLDGRQYRFVNDRDIFAAIVGEEE